MVTEEAIDNHDCRFQTYRELSPDWYWELDKNFGFSDFSTKMAAVTDTAIKTHYGKQAWNLSMPDNESLNWSNHQIVLQKNSAFRNFEHNRVDANGNVIWLLASGNPIFDSNNIFIGYRGICRVITDQKNGEKALRESEERLRLSLNMSGIGIWEWDMISDHVTWDKRQFELFGRAEVEGTISLSSITDVIHPDDREQLNRTAQRVLEKKGSASEEFRIILSDGSVRWLLGSSGIINVVNDKTTALLIGVNMDITKSKEIEFSLRESERNLQMLNATLESRITERTAELDLEAKLLANAQLELTRSNNLKLIGQLAGGIAHDFNNLLAIIGGNLELAMPLISHNKSRELVSKSLAAVNSGIGLNQRLLTFARKKRLKPVILSVGLQLQEVVVLLERTIGENILISTKIEPNSWETFIDPGEIDSAIINLSINARDAMPNGGELNFEVRNIAIKKQDSESHPNVIPGDFIGLFVTDNGKGMPADILQKAFDPLFTTKKQGTGLGLSSIYSFVQQSGGFLTIDSNVGIGTTVSMFLPRVTRQAAHPPDTDLNNKTTPQQNSDELILVVEDDPMVRELTVLRLKSIGYQVVYAASGQEAIDHLNDNQAIRLVFSDIVMPGAMTGYQLALWTVAHKPNVKILLTSGYFDYELAENNQLVDSRFSVLEKPYQLHQLASFIRHTLDS